MPIMFCFIDPFVMQQTVTAVLSDSSYTLFTAKDLNETCELLATYYSTGDFRQIVLKGTLAESVADQVRSYGKISYNLKDMNIEVLK